jgi:hypothetical protein
MLNSLAIQCRTVGDPFWHWAASAGWIGAAVINNIWVRVIPVDW